MSVIFLPLYGYVALLVQANLLISSALSGFRAQPSRPTTSFCATMSPYDVVEFSDKRGSKCPKKPQNSLFLLGVAVQSDLRGGSMSPRLFLQQNRAGFIFLNLLPFSPIFALSRGIGVLGHSRSLIATQGFLGAYTGISTAERKKVIEAAHLPSLIGLHLLGSGISYILLLFC